MKKNVVLIALLSVGLGLSSCGQHNQAPSLGANLESTRIYGQIGGAPLQLANKPAADDGTMAKRAEAIRTKLYPK